MKRMQNIELYVGAFMLAGLFALFVLAFKVSGYKQTWHSGSYDVTANFDNVGDLKVRAPVTLAGVQIGEVAHIDLDKATLMAKVDMTIYGEHKKIPVDSSARILTQGILGANYIGITPGYGEAVGEEDKGKQYLHDGSVVSNTTSAIILENLIGELVFNLKKK